MTQALGENDLLKAALACPSSKRRKIAFLVAIILMGVAIYA